MNMKNVMAFLFLVLALPNLAPAQTEPEQELEPAPAPEQQPVRERFVYEWTDDKGVVHLTDDPGQVPQKYRGSSLKKRAEPRKEEGAEKPQEKTVRSAPKTTVTSDQDLEERRRMDEWRQRYLEWKDKLRQAEQRYQSLQQRRTDLLAPWGSLSLAPPPTVAEFVQVEQALKDTQAEIDEARHMVEVVLPDEARKAGVPPGWLRE